jgi:beta-N-acetylhexosaminidase
VPELERLAGAVLCVGFEGASPEEAPLRELAQLAPGAIALFGRNVRDARQTRALVDAATAAIAERSGAEPFVAIDQEGGRVARLRGGAHEIPSMMALGAANDVELAERVGALVAKDLCAAGVTIDFAPVLDLALEPASSVIGTRSFGDDAERVAALGTAVMRGLERGGVVATIKHFPGHGATAGDSHELLPEVDASLATLRARDLVPFARAIAAGARAVMSAHVVVRSLDATRPATLSQRVLVDLLRDELGFTGVCFTDCLEMNAIATGVGTERGAVFALAAGADCATVSQSLERARGARDAIVAAVRSGELALQRLEEAAGRLTRLRAPHSDAGGRVDERAGIEAAQRAITLVRAPSDERFLSAGEPATVISFGDEDRPSLSLALRERRVRSELLRVPAEPAAEMIEQLVALAGAQRDRRFVLVMRRAHRHAAQRAALDALLAAVSDAILVSSLEPFDCALFGQARTVACTYGDERVEMEALADVLTRRLAAGGRLPVRLDHAACSD